MSKPSNMEERLEALRLYMEFVKLDDLVTAGDKSDGLVDRRDDAFQEYDDYGVTLMTDDDGNPMRCAASDVPLLEDDETVPVLRSAIGLPPKDCATIQPSAQVSEPLRNYDEAPTDPHHGGKIWKETV